MMILKSPDVSASLTLFFQGPSAAGAISLRREIPGFAAPPHGGCAFSEASDDEFNDATTSLKGRSLIAAKVEAGAVPEPDAD
jgi:hypothetical protein